MGRLTFRVDSRAARFGLFLVILALIFPRPVRASSTSAYAVIEAVNALRAAKGLAAYQVDGELMAYAQGHAEYEASIHTSTHTHKDGNMAWSLGMLENIAEGDLGYLTPDFAVNVIWQDAIHLGPMIDYQSGYVGAGVANDGETEYYTLNIRPGASAAKTLKPGQTPSAGVTQPPIVPLKETATPRADGGILHKVGYGQTLWTIAQLYGIKIDELRRLNNMAAEDNDIYSGQKLWIRWPLPLTATAAAANHIATTTLTPTPQAELRVGEFVADNTITAAPAVTITEPAAISIAQARPTASATAAPQTPGAFLITTKAALDEEVAFQPLPMSPLVAGLLILAGAGILGVLAITLIRKG